MQKQAELYRGKAKSAMIRQQGMARALNSLIAKGW